MRLGLKEARSKAGLTQEQAGALIGKTRSAYTKIESGIQELTAADAILLARELKTIVEVITPDTSEVPE